MRRQRARAVGITRAVTAAVAVVLLAGCSAAEYEPAGPWVPQVDGGPPVVAPPEDGGVPEAPDPDNPADPLPDGTDPNVVASGLDTPWGLAVLPDGSALVGERRTGRILQVFPDRSEPLVVMTIPGLDASGDGGLLGLALSPAYAEDALIYAYTTTAADNRVLRFSLGGIPQPIVTGIPKGPTGNGGRIAFGADELLYVGTGDSGNPALAADPASLAGKVLRYDIFGQPAATEPAEPTPASPVFSRGHSNVTGMCFDGADRLFVTETSQPAGDELNLLEAGADYGWRDRLGSQGPVSTYEAAGLGGCTIVNQVAFLGAVDGERVIVTILDGNGAAVGDPQDFLAADYGRLRTVVADEFGALWVTTSNLDGPGEVDPDDDQVLRVLPPPDAGGGVT